MAIIYPNNPVGALPPETVKVFRLLKRLSDERYAVWQRLTIDAEASPDFWVRHSSGRSLLIKVSLAAAQAARNARQASLFANDNQSFGMPEEGALQKFLNALDTSDCPLGADQMPLAVLFPNVPSADLQLALPQESSSALHWAGRDELAPDRFASWIESKLGEALLPSQIDRLRAAFTPEVVVPAALTVLQPLHRDTSARLTDYLLSYEQERTLKLDLARDDM